MDSSKPNAKQTLVEEGTEFHGTLTSNCQVVVNGTIDGEIEAPELRVAPGGKVLGNVKARRVRSEGVLAGSIDAEDVFLSGTVKSNTIIRATKLEAKLATDRGRLEVSFGECLLEIGEDPALAHEREPSPPAPNTARAEAPSDGARTPIAAPAARPEA
jgi:cytoskeletal protein CcmA (bactofilin family)